jgi:hypothetical protein
MPKDPGVAIENANPRADRLWQPGPPVEFPTRTGSQAESAVKEPPHYLSYLLRLWRVDGEGAEPVWRTSLESSRTGERMVFTRLEDLFDFLREQTNGPQSHPIHQDSSSTD